MMLGDVHDNLEEQRCKRDARSESPVCDDGDYRNDSEYDSTRFGK
jgi:hypothetical protein